MVSFDQGRSSVVADLGTSLGLRLFRYGVHDPELELTRRLLRPGDLFVDVGANIGLFSLVAAAKVGAAGSVVACEPVLRMRAVVQRNARLNGFAWIECLGVALADQPGSADFVVFDGDGSGLSSFRPASPDGGRIEVVRVTTLDEALSRGDHARVSLLKIDAEGAEARVLRGGAAVIAASKPDLILEVEPEHLARQGSTVEELQGFAAEAGYRSYRVGRDTDGGIVLRPEGDWRRPSCRPNLFLTTDPARSVAAGIAIMDAAEPLGR